MLQAHLRRAIDILGEKDVQGARANAQGAAEYSTRVRAAEFFSVLSKAEQVAMSLDPSQERLYVSSARQAVSDQMRTSAVEIGYFAMQAPQSNLALFRQAAQAAGYQIPADILEDNFVAATESILIEVFKRSYDIGVSVYSGETLRAKLEAEAKELSRALKAADIDEMSIILKGILNRAECILNQQAAPPPPQASNGRGWQGPLGVELPAPAEYVRSPSLGPIRCWLNYEVLSPGAPPTFFVSIRPPLTAAPSVVHSLGRGDGLMGAVPWANDADLRSLLHSLEDCAETRTISFKAPESFQTISFFSLDVSAGGTTADMPVNKAPILGRIAHSDMATLEHKATNLVRALANLNSLLCLCFGTPNSNSFADERTAVTSEQRLVKRGLFTVAVGSYARGLILKVQGEVGFELFVNVEALTVENVSPMRGNPEQTLSVGTNILRESMYLPAIVHAYAYMHLMM